MISYLRTRESIGSDREVGAVGAEYAGAIVIVVLLIGSLLMGFGAGGPVSEQIKYVICQALTFGQGGCEAPSSGAAGGEDNAPTHPCVQVSTTDTRAVSLVVVSVAAKGGGTIQVDEMSDGTWRVTASGDAGVGLSAGVGAGLSVTVDDGVYGIEASAGASAYVAGDGGMTWVIDNEADKERLVEYLKDERNKLTVASMGPAGAIVAGGMHTWDWLTGDGYSPGSPTEVYVQAGVDADASAQASGVVVSGSAGADAAVAIGARVNLEDGTVTHYFTYELGLGAGAAYDDVVGRAEAGGSGSAEVLLAVTVDPAGNMLHMEAQGQAVGEWKAQVSDVFTGGDAVGPSGNGGYLYSASMDLTGDEVASIAADLLYASGALPGHQPPQHRLDSLDSAVTTLIDAARESGVVTRQELTTNTTVPFAIQGVGELGVAFGGSFENSTTTITSTGAEYLSGGVWKEWVACG